MECGYGLQMISRLPIVFVHFTVDQIVLVLYVVFVKYEL